MEVLKSNYFQYKRKAKRVSDRYAHNKRPSLAREIYDALVDVHDSVSVNYISESTMQGLRSSLLVLSKKNHDGLRRFKLRDNGDDISFTVYRVK